METIPNNKVVTRVNFSFPVFKKMVYDLAVLKNRTEKVTTIYSNEKNEFTHSGSQTRRKNSNYRLAIGLTSRFND